MPTASAVATAGCAGKVGRDLPVAMPSKSGCLPPPGSKPTGARRRPARGAGIAASCAIASWCSSATRMAWARAQPVGLFGDEVGGVHAGWCAVCTKAGSSRSMHRCPSWRARRERASDANWPNGAAADAAHTCRWLRACAFHDDPSSHPHLQRADRPVRLRADVACWRCRRDAIPLFERGRIDRWCGHHDRGRRRPAGVRRHALFDPLQMANVDWMFRDRAGRFPVDGACGCVRMDMAQARAAVPAAAASGTVSGSLPPTSAMKPAGWPSAGYACTCGRTSATRARQRGYLPTASKASASMVPDARRGGGRLGQLPGNEDRAYVDRGQALATSVARGADAPGQDTKRA